MATRVIHQLIDDISGEPIDSEAGETVEFSLDGVRYEIDLSAERAGELRAALEPFISAGRRSGSRVPAPRATARRASSRSGVDAGAVREWAKSQGISVSARGRVPQPIIDQYLSR